MAELTSGRFWATALPCSLRYAGRITMGESTTLRWLLVDDHSTVAESLPRSIDERVEGLEHVYPVAMHAEEAWRRLERTPVDLVLLDVRIRAHARRWLPDGSREHGWHCAAEINECFPQTRIVLFSADLPDPSSPIDQPGLFELGGAACLSG